MKKNSKRKKNLQSNPLHCKRRLGLYKKKLYKNEKQLIYTSLSGITYTKEHYREIVASDIHILDQLNISRNGSHSDIKDIHLFYNTVYNFKNEYSNPFFEETQLEYFCIPPSIIKCSITNSVFMNFIKIK